MISTIGGIRDYVHDLLFPQAEDTFDFHTVLRSQKNDDLGFRSMLEAILHQIVFGGTYYSVFRIL